MPMGPGMSTAMGAAAATPWGAIASGLGSLVSSFIGGSSAASQQAWQEHMANTAHQREVRDLRLAGLNPILSVMGGNGAQTPTGTMFTPGNPLQDFQANLASAADVGYKGRQQSNLDQTTQADLAVKGATVKNLGAQNENLQADTVQKIEEANYKKALQVQSNAQTALLAKQTTQYDWLKNKIDAEIGLIGATAAREGSTIALQSQHSAQSVAQTNLINKQLYQLGLKDPELENLSRTEQDEAAPWLHAGKFIGDKLKPWLDFWGNFAPRR